MATPAAAAAAEATATGSNHVSSSTGAGANPATAGITSGKSSPAALVGTAMPHMQQSMAGLCASLGKHEHVIARLRQQLNDSLAQHQQKLTQELARIIQATAEHAAAGATVGAAASAAAAINWAQVAAAAACGSAGGGQVAVTTKGSSSRKTCTCMCTCAFTSNGAAASATASSRGMSSMSHHLANHSSGGSHQRWEAAGLTAQLQLAADRIQLLQSQLESAEAKLAMHRAAAVAAKQRIDGLQGVLVQLQQQHSTKLLQTLLGPQQLPEAAAVGMPTTCSCCDGRVCCCGRASTDGCASQPDAAAAAAAAGTTVVDWQQQQQQKPVWELALSPSYPPAVLLQQQQLRRAQDQLRMAICDNTVLSYECMHLQQLLVQERFVGRSACQAVALQLASDAIQLRSQLEDAQVELGIEKLARQVQQQLTAGPAAEQQQQGEATAACTSVEECLEQCRAIVLETLQERRLENEAALELLDSKLSGIGAWYEDSSWADGIQQQLAAIEQAFAGSLQQQQPPGGLPDQQQGGEALLQEAAAAAAACSSELLQSHRSKQIDILQGSSQQQLQPVAGAGTRAAGKPTAKSYVTTPSGHVSMISSRRGTQVLSALDVALSSSRRATVLDSMTVPGRRSTRSMYSAIGAPATADAALACGALSSSCTAEPAGLAGALAARHKTRRSTLGVVARAACAVQQQQEETATEERAEVQPCTFLVLSKAAQRLSAEQEEEEQQLPAWQSVAAADGPGNCSNELLLVLDDSTTAFGDGCDAADDWNEDSSSRQSAELQGEWSLAAALVDAMQQAALAVLTQQQQQQAQALESPAEYEQPQQQRMATSSAAAFVQGQQQPSAAGTGSCARAQAQAADQEAAADGEDALWDADEGNLPSGPAMPGQQQHQQHCGSLQLLKQQLAEQRARTQQLQQQLELEHSQLQFDGVAVLSEACSSTGCSPGGAGLQQQQQQQQQQQGLGKLPSVQPSCAWGEASSSCMAGWGSVIGEKGHAACTDVLGGAAVGLGATNVYNNGKDGADAEQQLQECRVALAAQHAACEQLRQQNEQLLAALQQAGGMC